MMRREPVRRRRSLGQSLVEVAIASPFLILLLVCTAQVGLIYYVQMSVTGAAREGGRVASEKPGNTALFSGSYSPSAPRNTPYTCSGPSDSLLACQAAYNSTHGALGGLINTSNLTVTLTGGTFTGSTATTCTGGSGTSDGVVTVNVSYNVPVFIPLIGNLFDSPGNSYRKVSFTTTVRVEPCNETSGA